MGPSLTSRGQADRAGLAARDLAGRVDQDLDPGRVDPVDLGLADLAVRGRVGLVAQDLDPGRVDPVDPAARDPALLDRVDLAVLAHIRGRVDLVDRADPEDRADPGRVGPVVPVDIRDRVDLVDRAGLDLAGRENLGDQGMGRADPAGRVDRADLVDRAGPVVRVDRHRRRTHPGVRTSGVAPRWAARGMRLTASAHPTTVRRRHPHNTDSAGMVGLHPERRRLSGTDRRPRVAGTVHRLPVVGTTHGTVRRVT